MIELLAALRYIVIKFSSPLSLKYHKDGRTDIAISTSKSSVYIVYIYSENISIMDIKAILCYLWGSIFAIQSQDFPNFKRDNVLRAAISK